MGVDAEIRALERAVLSVGRSRYVALIPPTNDTVDFQSGWERVTLVGFLGHPGCLVSQNRKHYYLTYIHTIAALDALPGVALVYDLEKRAPVRPCIASFYMTELEDGWTDPSDRGDDWSDPYRPLFPLYRRPVDYRGPLHEELDRNHEEFKKRRAEITRGAVAPPRPSANGQEQ